MNSPNSSKSTSPPLPNLSAPNKTFAARKPARRSSTFSSNSPASPVSSLSQSPLSPSNELPETFTGLSPPLQQQASLSSTAAATTSSSLRQTIASTTSSLLRKASDVAHTAYFTPTQLAALKTFCSPVSLDETDPSFWANLLENKKYPSINSPQEAYDLEMETVGLSIELAANNPRTKNFTKLVLHLLNEIRQYDMANIESIAVKTFNALFLTRVFSKHFASNLSNTEIIQQFEAGNGEVLGASLSSSFKNLSIDSDNGRIAERLLDSLFTVVVNMNPCQNYSTYEFYIETLNTLIILMSTQLHHPRTTDENYFIDIIMEKFSKRSDALVAKLLQNFIEQKMAPSQSSSMVYNAYSYFFPGRSGSISDADIPPVADRSLLLLLLLGAQPGPSSPFRTAFNRLRDHHDLSLSLDESKNEQKFHLIPFKDLFEIFCRNITIEEQMLLFYLMLAENESFRVYVLSRTDPETLYIPILKIIYEAAERDTNYPQVYILLIILLILSQDDMNNETVQKVNVHNLTWITERTVLKSLSLGNLVFLVLIRMLQFNLSHQRDIYLHTNCLGILINMSKTALDMHSYVAQKLTSLLELISKRQQKVAKKANTPVDHTLAQDITVYEDMISLILEIIRSILKHRLKNNSQLVYAVLLKQEIFVPLRDHTRLAAQIKNLDDVISHFSARVAEANLKAPSTAEILNLIDQASRTWTPKAFEAELDLTFQYKENEDSHEFFIPYCWELTHRRPFLPWSEEKAHVLEEYRILRHYPQANNNVF